jgi:hypothetical protein
MSNTIYIKSTTSGTSPEIEARGASDTNVDLILTPKGTGRAKSKGETLAYVSEISGGGITWSVVTSDGNLVADTGILANKGTLLTLTLPTTCAVGKTIRVAGMNAGLWKIAQNASQYIKFGNQTTTTGTGGYISSVLTYDAVELVCIEADLGFVVVSSVGNLTVN